MAEEKKVEKVDADRLCNAIIDLGDWIRQNYADIPVTVRLTYWWFLVAMRKFCVKMAKETRKWKNIIC